MTSREQHDRMANAIRFLAMDAVEKANSGHPGLPMGMADVATVLFTKYLKFDPKKPHWPNRDRFVLSAGHGSMLLYSLLYLTGYPDMTVEDLKQFRQVGSKTAGHPEYGHATGIETTTGPLGQGIANSVGMAIAERKLREEFGADLQDHYTYAMCGDGCLMEGISHEAIALAGHLKLNKLILFWDNNSITIDGAVSLSDSTDQVARFKAVHWNTIEVDGHDQSAVAAAIEAAHVSDRPTFIACKTIIGFGAPNKQGTHKVHGTPLGAEEIAATRKALNWEYEPFVIPSDVLDAWRAAGTRSVDVVKAWEDGLANAPAKAEFNRRFAGELPQGFDAAITEFNKKLAETKPTVATRKASEDVLEIINGFLPETLGGSADLTPSNNTKTSQMHSITPTDFAGRYMHWGIREHGMASAMNGVALHGGLIPYGGGFMIFSDYCRPPIRLASLMGIRQNLLAARTEYSEKNLCELGAYTLAGKADAKVTIFASGSEVELAVAARATLEGKGITVRVVSVPSTELFFEQPDAYRKEILGNSPVKIAVEAAVREGWDAFIGPEGTFIGMKGFGASGPAKDVYKHFGITAEAVVAAAEAKLA
jgi:transketolase